MPHIKCNAKSKLLIRFQRFYHQNKALFSLGLFPPSKRSDCPSVSDQGGLKPGKNQLRNICAIRHQTSTCMQNHGNFVAQKSFPILTARVPDVILGIANQPVRVQDSAMPYDKLFCSC